MRECEWVIVNGEPKDRGSLSRKGREESEPERIRSGSSTTCGDAPTAILFESRRHYRVDEGEAVRSAPPSSIVPAFVGRKGTIQSPPEVKNGAPSSIPKRTGEALVAFEQAASKDFASLERPGAT